MSQAKHKRHIKMKNIKGIITAPVPNIPVHISAVCLRGSGMIQHIQRELYYLAGEDAV